MSQARALALGPDELGEGIGWLAETQSLLRVDILRGLIHRVQGALTAEPVVETQSFEGEVGFALPRRSGGFVIGVEQRLELIAADGTRSLLLELDEPSDHRFNDAIGDALGRLWAGTFARERRRGAANLYRIDPDGSIELVLDGLTIANGLGWLDDGERLHFIDSPTQRVEVFDVDIAAGTLSGRRTLAEVPVEAGAPDGLCVDDQDGTWVALFGGGAVRRYSREGGLTEEVTLPVPHVTNVCLGGAELADLFITTTRHRLSDQERQQLPQAGRVFHAPVEVAAPGGLAAFAG